MIIVYRIERKQDRKGPFSGRFDGFGNGMDVAQDWWAALSMPEPLHQRQRGWVCGCVSGGQLRQWFRSRRLARAMYKQGFRLVKYQVPEDCAHVDPFQVLFCQESAIVINRR